MQTTTALAGMLATIPPDLTAREALTVIVCTKDEERDLPRMLASVAWAEEVVVVDCGSQDATVARALEAGARVEHQPWLGYSAQKNHAARLASHDWVLSLDADEVVTAELRGAIERALAARPDPADGWWVDRRPDFLGRLLPNPQRRAARERAFVRLYHRGRSAWDEALAVHEVVRVPGRVHRLDGRLLHVNDFTFGELVRLFDHYSDAEAAALHARGRTSALGVVGWPVARFLWLLVGRGEWRLGGHGLVHAGLKAAAELMARGKAWELGLASRTVPREELEP